MIEKILNPKILKYLFVGLCTVGIDYSAIFIVYNLFELNYMIAIISGFLVSNIFQFYMNFFYTFNLKRNEMIAFKMMVFCIVVIVGNSLAFLLIIILKYFINNIFIIKTLSLPLSFFYGYITSNKIIYNQNFYIYVTNRMNLCKKYF